MEILYQDSEIAVVCKPRGVLSEGADVGGMPSLLAAEIGSEIFTVHRLDREIGVVDDRARLKEQRLYLLII